MEKDYKYYIDLCKRQDYERIFPNIEEMNSSKNFYKENGFHYEDTWNLDRTIIKFILPRLAYFRDNHDGTPMKMCDEMGLDTIKFTEEDWARHDEIADEFWVDKINIILNGFEIYLVRDWCDWTQEDKIAIDKAWDNFRKYFKYFWN
jgi:hypothetical protein